MKDILHSKYYLSLFYNFNPKAILNFSIQNNLSKNVAHTLGARKGNNFNHSDSYREGIKLTGEIKTRRLRILGYEYVLRFYKFLTPYKYIYIA